MAKCSNKVATIVGYHGKQNIGDDIFLFVTTDWLRRQGVNKVFVTGDKQFIPHELNGISVISFTNPIRSIARFNWVQVLKYGLQSDFLVFAAGSIFTIQPFCLASAVLFLIRLIKGNRIKVIALGVSLGPFGSDFRRKCCGLMLKTFDLVLVRDNKSGNVALRLGVRKANFIQGRDIALPFLTKNISQEHEYRDNILTSIALCVTSRGYGSCIDGEHSDACNSLTQFINTLSDTNQIIHLKLICVCGDIDQGDLKLCKHIAKRLASGSVRLSISQYRVGNTTEIINLISSCSMMISYRMHAGIISLINSVPLLQIAYSEKIRSFYMSNGLDEKFLLSPDELTVARLKTFYNQASSGELSQSTARNQRKIIANSLELQTILQNLRF